MRMNRNWFWFDCGYGPQEEAWKMSLEDWLNNQDIHAVVIDWDMAAHDLLKDKFQKEGEHGVRLVRPINGWQVSYRDELHSPSHVLMLTRISPR